MPHPPFDPSKAVTFDLVHGQVYLGEATASLLLPVTALLPLVCGEPDERAAAVARAIGTSFGHRVAKRFGADVDAPEKLLSASVEAVVDHLGGELALAGFGSLRLERWGRALVLLLDSVPFDVAGDTWVALLLAAALESATTRPVGCLPLMRDSDQVRFLIANGSTVEQTHAWLRQGITWGDALARLHTQQAGA